MKILICEDEEILLTAIEFRLRKKGFNVLLAPDRQTAEEIVREQTPDLIVADIGMPGLSPQQLLQLIQSISGKSVPLIVIGALDEDEKVLKILRDCATDFVIKPFKPAELVLRIQKVFQEKESL